MTTIQETLINKYIYIDKSNSKHYEVIQLILHYYGCRWGLITNPIKSVQEQEFVILINDFLYMSLYSNRESIQFYKKLQQKEILSIEYILSL